MGMEKRKKKNSSMNNNTSIVDQIRNIRSKVPNSINTNFNSRVSLPPPEIKRTKRVRFEEPDSPHALPCEPNTYSRNVSRNLSPNGEEPKTSEFAFYKKLREDAAARSSHSYQLHKEDKQLEKTQPKFHSKDLTQMTKPDRGIKCFPPIEKGTPISIVSATSPKVSINYGARSEPELEHGDIFSIKRQKLLHFATEALSLDVQKQCSSGFDLVSMLLQRLHPERNAIAETTCFRSSDTKFNKNSQLHVSVESATPDEISQPARMNLICPMDMENLEYGWRHNSREYTLSQDVGKDLSSLLTWYPNNITREYEERQPAGTLDCGATSNLHVSVESATPYDDISRPAKMSLICPLSMKNLENGWPHRSREYSSSQEIGEDLSSLLTWYPNNIPREYEERQPVDTLDCGATSNLLVLRDSNFHVQPDERYLLNRSEILALDKCETRQLNSCFDIQLDAEFSSKRREFLALDYMPNSSNLIYPTSQNFAYNSGSSEKSFDLGSRSSFTELDDDLCSSKLATVSKLSSQFLCRGNSTIEKEQNFFSSASGTPLEDILQSENCITNATEMYPPFLQGIRYCSDIMFGNVFSNRYLIDCIERRSPEKRECQVEEPDDFLPVCSTPKYLDQEEGCRLSSHMHKTSVFSSPPTSPISGIHLQSTIDLDCDLRIIGEDMKGGGITEGERFMNSLIDGEDETRLTERSCHFEIPCSKEFCTLFLKEPSRTMASGEFCYDRTGDYGGQLCLMDSPASAFIMD
ncbi:hypothetical protein ACHQM5_001398 [Ranunculus cassubicifolius]